jgi:mono/diheme cytochrome c family protein
MRNWKVLVAVAVAVGCALPLAGRAGEPEPQEERNVWSGVYTKEQADRGHAIYLGKCAQCHAESLAGNPPAPALRGGGFVARWNGQSVRDIHSRIRSTMPLNAPGELTRPETFDLVSYLFQSNGFPAGTRELSGLPAELQQIKITLQKQ